MALSLMFMYAHGDRDKLEGFRPQIRRAVENLSWWESDGQGVRTIGNFSDVVNWLLRKGREDRDARAVALELAKRVVDSRALRDMLHSHKLISVLLANFPEIAWPIIGNAVLSGPSQAFLLKYALGDSAGFPGRRKPGILSLPEDVLFAWCHANTDSVPAFAAEVFPSLPALIQATRNGPCTPSWLDSSTSSAIGMMSGGPSTGTSIPLDGQGLQPRTTNSTNVRCPHSSATHVDSPNGSQTSAKESGLEHQVRPRRGRGVGSSARFLVTGLAPYQLAFVQGGTRE